VTLQPFVDALRRGEIVAFPTESSWGLGVDARSADALERLFALKGREPGKPPPVLVDGERMLGDLVTRVPARARTLIARFWPGALTLVLPARPELPAPLVLDGGIGVRHSPHPVATALVTAFGGPLTATSANRSGEPACQSPADVRAAFGDRVHVLDGDAGGAAPSTVVRVTDDGGLTILRRGAIDPSLLEG
jgi:L-threonylcarbamoyladenylate synthase